jgi:hypothetical protein
MSAMSKRMRELSNEDATSSVSSTSAKVTFQFAPPLRNGDASLEQYGAELVNQCCALAYQPRARPVQALHVELRLTLELDKPHGWARRGFGIPFVILLRFHIRLHVFRRHQPDLVADLLQSTAEVMRAAASFHSH